MPFIQILLLIVSASSGLLGAATASFSYKEGNTNQQIKGLGLMTLAILMAIITNLIK